MFDRIEKMGLQAQQHALGLLASMFTTGTIREIRQHIMDRIADAEYIEATGDVRAEQDNARRHDSNISRIAEERDGRAGSSTGHDKAERGNEGAGADTGTNVFGTEVRIEPYRLAQLNDRLRAYSLELLAEITSNPRFSPQSYGDRLVWLSSNTVNPGGMPADKEQRERLERLMKAGKITQAHVDRALKLQAERRAAPYKAHGSEIMYEIHALPGTYGDMGPPSDADWDQLPYRQQRLIIDGLIDRLQARITDYYMRSALGQPFNGLEPAELESEAVLLEKEVEPLRHYRVDWFRRHKHQIDAEEADFAIYLANRSSQRAEARAAAKAETKAA